MSQSLQLPNPRVKFGGALERCGWKFGGVQGLEIEVQPQETGSTFPPLDGKSLNVIHSCDGKEVFPHFREL